MGMETLNLSSILIKNTEDFFLGCIIFYLKGKIWHKTVCLFRWERWMKDYESNIGEIKIW